MKIAIDGNEILFGERAIRRYVHHLIHQLIRLQAEPEFNFYYFRFRKPPHEAPSIPEESKRSKNRFIYLPGSWVEKSWAKFQWPPLSCFLGEMDLIHAPGHILPAKGKAPLVLTLHAMHHLIIPQFFKAEHLKLYELFIKRALKVADYFITVSESMRETFLEAYPVSPNRVKAIPLGVSQEFCPQPKNETALFLKTRFGIDRPYLLYVGGIQKHKNVQGIIEAFWQLKSRKSSNLLLVLCGDLPQGSSEILDLITKWQLEKDVLVTGYIHQEAKDLVYLYSGASLFIFPTFWEGWSSPPLEAMACGIPVIASDIKPHRENLGTAACLVDPAQPQIISEKMAEILNDSVLRFKMIQDGFKHVTPFAWETMALKTLDYYASIGREVRGYV